MKHAPRLSSFTNSSLGTKLCFPGVSSDFRAICFPFHLNKTPGLCLFSGAYPHLPGPTTCLAFPGVWSQQELAVCGLDGLETPAGTGPWPHVTGSGIPTFPAGNSCARDSPSLTGFGGWWWGPSPSKRGEIYFVGKEVHLLEEFKISFASCEIELTVLFYPQQGKHQNGEEK